MKVLGPKAADLVFEALREKKAEKELIAHSTLHEPMKARLEERGVKLTPAGDFMNEVRMIKTQDEIAIMRWTGAMADTAWWKMYQNMQIGVRDRELSAIGAAALIAMGAEGPFWCSVRGGPYTSPNFMGMITDRMMQYGDMGFCDIWGAMYLGYRTCYYRTWKIGCKPTPTASAPSTPSSTGSAPSASRWTTSMLCACAGSAASLSAWRAGMNRCWPGCANPAPRRPCWTPSSASRRPGSTSASSC